MEVIDSVQDYRATLQEVFDFNLLRKFVSRKDFSLVFDALWAVTGAYAGPLLVDDLGADPSSIRSCSLHLSLQAGPGLLAMGCKAGHG